MVAQYACSPWCGRCSAHAEFTIVDRAQQIGQPLDVVTSTPVM
jgi:hypothetical protein